MQFMELPTAFYELTERTWGANCCRYPISDITDICQPVCWSYLWPHVNQPLFLSTRLKSRNCPSSAFSTSLAYRMSVIYRVSEKSETKGIVFLTYIPCPTCSPRYWALSQLLYQVCAVSAQYIGMDCSTTGYNCLPKVTKVSHFDTVQLCSLRNPQNAKSRWSWWPLH
jgi:hypothetical protein